MAQVVNIDKYKNHNEINAVAKHNLRCYIPKNVDEDRQKDNIYFVGEQGQKGIAKTVAERLKDIPHRKDANKVINLVFGASQEEFEKMGEEKAKKWATELNNYCIKKFGKENVLYSVLHNDETTKHLHFSFLPLRDGKLQSNFWFDGPSKLKRFRNEIYEINKKYGIAPDAPKPKEDKADRQEIDEFYDKVKRSEKLDDSIDKEIEKLKAIDTINPFTLKSKIEEATKAIRKVSEYAQTSSVRVNRYKSKNKSLRKQNDKLKEENEKLKADLKRFEEVDNIKKLNYIELSELNDYIDVKYSKAIEQRELKKSNKSTVELEAQPVVELEHPVDKRIKPK